MFVDIENVGSKQNISIMNQYLDTYNFKFSKIVTSTRSLKFIKKYESILKNWGFQYFYNQSKKIKDGADKSILNMLKIFGNKGSKCVLFSDDNVLVEEFIKICKLKKIVYVVLSTNRLRPKFIRQNHLTSQSIIID